MNKIHRPPHEILGLSGDAGLREVRKKYKQLIRQFTPEHHPDEFEKISLAYREVIGENPVDQNIFPIYCFPLTFLEKEIEAQGGRKDEDNLLPLAMIPESIFSVEFELEKVIR